jgi:hypothetical protein
VKRTRTSLARRAIVWTASGVLSFSAAAWGVGLFQVYWASSAVNERLFVGVVYGIAEISSRSSRHANSPPLPGAHALGFTLHQEWWPPRNRHRWRFVLPLWIPAAGAALTLGAVSFVSRRERTRAGAGHCSFCAYDLSGITGPCPECGSEREPDARRGRV